MSITATHLRDIEGWTGDARLYKLSEPVTYDEGDSFDHVIVSATVAILSGPETYIFPADANGEPLGFLELDGSYRGGLDHEAAILGAGWDVA